MKARVGIHFSVAAVLGAFFVFASSPASAITVIPPSIEYSDVNPGEVITDKVKLFNETTSIVQYFSSVANFTSKDETGSPQFLPEDSSEGLATWMTLEKGPLDLQPGERREIPIEIKVPSDASPGGHYASIFFSDQPEAGAGPAQVTIGSRIGILVLLRIQGAINESGTIASFETSDGQRNFSRLPIEFLLRFQNSGNVHVRPTGSVTVRNMLGGTSAVLPVNTGQGAVLPQSIRKFEVSWERKPGQESQGNFFQEIGREWQNFGLGPYTANVLLTYGQSNDKTVSSTLTFWVFPWRVLILWVIGIVVLIWLIVLLIKRYNRWIISRVAKGPVQKK